MSVMKMKEDGNVATDDKEKKTTVDRVRERSRGYGIQAKI